MLSKAKWFACSVSLARFGYGNRKIRRDYLNLLHNFHKIPKENAVYSSFHSSKCQAADCPISFYLIATSFLVGKSF